MARPSGTEQIGLPEEDNQDFLTVARVLKSSQMW